jgi:hypothetical protein
VRGALVALLAALPAIGTGGCRTGAGSLDARAVALAEETALDGAVGIALDRGGAVREVVAEVGPARLPEDVALAARVERPGAAIAGATRVLLADGSEAWDVRLVDGGARAAVRIGAAGAVLASEADIARDAAPIAVRRGADAALPGGAFRGVAEVRSAGVRSFQVRKDRDGASYVIELDEAGNLLRLTRRVRATVEVPVGTRERP